MSKVEVARLGENDLQCRDCDEREREKRTERGGGE